MNQTRLSNGVQVLTERIPGVRSAAIGVWVRQGSAHEPVDLMGASHLLEHLVFKGTEKRTAREIALALESLGGSLDAFTSREHTSFQARVLDEHLPLALEVLADLVLSPVLRDEDLELEREVVLEEIATVLDTPDDLVFDLHGSRLWGGHPYGNKILGTRDTVGSMPGQALRDLHRSRYTGRNLVVAAAGQVKHEEVVEQVEMLFGSHPSGVSAPPLPDIPSNVMGDESAPRPTSQTHLVFGRAIPGHSDPRRFSLALLSSALGGGMSSRLFQRVREELGLAYSVFTFQSFYSKAGISGVYVGTRPSTAEKAVEVVRRELDDVAQNGMPSGELEQIKQQVKGQIMLSLESTGARLYRLASFSLHGEPFATLDELLGKIDSVTEKQVSDIGAEFFSPDGFFLLRLGPSGDLPQEPDVT
ncbi:MAG: insulinase family protein [Gemmatimonadetes bacterium]|nr:insulinase family protein [Gemmatimonadota bacterium]NNM05527.1 insulinase family protein [Gemmatimonadota bacterium]